MWKGLVPVGLGILFPMMGLTMLIVWISDRLLFSPGRVASTR
jgi:uncharacterized iron-regulated membrane protein